MYYVYKITNTINGKFYIGVHKTDDFESSAYMGSGPLIKKAVSKYGRDSFTREVLLVCESSGEAYAKERELVDPYDPQSYNLNTGGLGGFDYINSLGLPNPMHDPDAVQKNRKSRKRTYEKNPEHYASIAKANLAKAVEANRGSERSEEHRRKSSEALKEYYASHEHPAKGTKRTNETRRMLSESWTDDRKQAKSEWMKQRILDDPTITQTNLGKKFSDDVKRKMSDSAKLSWITRKSIICPHCNKESKNAANMKRWHFDNCKETPIND